MYYKRFIIFNIIDFILRIVYNNPDTKSSIISKNWAINFLARNDDYRIRIVKSFF